MVSDCSAGSRTANRRCGDHQGDRCWVAAFTASSKPTGDWPALPNPSLGQAFRRPHPGQVSQHRRSCRRNASGRGFRWIERTGHGAARVDLQKRVGDEVVGLAVGGEHAAGEHWRTLRLKRHFADAHRRRGKRGVPLVSDLRLLDMVLWTAMDDQLATSTGSPPKWLGRPQGAHIPCDAIAPESIRPGP